VVVFSTEDKVQGGPNLEGCLYTYSKFEHQEQFASYCTKLARETLARPGGTAIWLLMMTRVPAMKSRMRHAARISKAEWSD
jgi:hypothetical protein